ncbi:hypothetical protein PG993_010524 [Apiospora rasikravindrae]|uniref:Transmembrane protein n=1 Tax=Apiospora rasikravindrae TaxID=990691 RepID=A0ABR1SMI9_9PEZI
MARTASHWQVNTFKRVTDADGNRTTEQFSETVEPGHKLLNQSCSPTFIKGKPGRPQCVVRSVMAVTTAETVFHSFGAQEYTVPEYQVVKQAQLEKHCGRMWATRFRKLLYRFCGLKSILWWDYLVDKAAEFTRFLWSFISAKTFRIAVFLSLLLLIVLGLLAQNSPDVRLEKTFETHHDILKMLNDTRPVRSLSISISRQANQAESMSFRIEGTHLPDKAIIVDGIKETAASMHVMGDTLLEFRWHVRDMATDLQWAHGSVLSRLEERSRRPWYSFLSIESRMSLSERQLRREWISATIQLKNTLAGLVKDADLIRDELQSIDKALKGVERKMTTSQQAQMNLLKYKASTWLSWFNVFDTPTSIYESDIELVDSFLPQVREASKYVLDLRKDIVTAYQSLVGLENMSPVEKGFDLLHNFGHHQFHAKRLLKQLMKAIDYETGPIRETETTKTATTITATTVPTN